MVTQSYAISSWVFLRGLSAVYMVAFLSLALETRGLWGERGVLPASRFLESVGANSVGERLWHLPSVFWMNSSDAALVAAAWIGVGVSLLAFLGVAQGAMLLAAFLLYLSFVSVGQDFLSFQWDILLLEVGFLALFAAPWLTLWSWNQAAEPHIFVRYAFYAVLFKLMFLSGVVKLMSGDTSWRDLSALTYHYWTQPLPNPLSPFVHALPAWLHKTSTFITFVIELPLPFLIFWPRARMAVAFSFIALSLMIFLTGNYTFFNLLTIALCFWLVPDSAWSKILPIVHGPIAPASESLMVAAVMSVLIFFSFLWCVRYFVPAEMDSLLHPVYRFARTWNISNSYGLFAHMTKSRPEIVLEVSVDGVEWREWEFKFKPGDTRRRPPVIEPLQPRLDWQMWFAALGSFNQTRWLPNLMGRILEGRPEVLALLEKSPFGDKPPKFIRAKLYAYEFANPGEILSKGIWWKRTELGPYSPSFGLPN